MAVRIKVLHISFRYSELMNNFDHNLFLTQLPISKWGILLLP